MRSEGAGASTTWVAIENCVRESAGARVCGGVIVCVGKGKTSVAQKARGLDDVKPHLHLHAAVRVARRNRVQRLLAHFQRPSVDGAWLSLLASIVGAHLQGAFCWPRIQCNEPEDSFSA